MDVSMGEEEEYDGEEEAESLTSENIMKTAITGRGVTLHMLINDGIIEPGNGLLTLKYLGRKFIADLLPNGKIMTPATKEMFGTPSAWAAHCKRQVNPNKKSGCGWNSVMYKGKKLDMWKTTWFRKHRPSSPARRESTSPRVFMMEQNHNVERPGSTASVHSSHSDHKAFDFSDHMKGMAMNLRDQNEESNQNGKTSPSDTVSVPPPIDLSVKSAIKNGSSSQKNSAESMENSFQEEALNLSLKEPVKKNRSETENQNSNGHVKGQSSVHHSSLTKGNQELDPCTFVLCESFKSLGKTQPFTVSLATNALLLLDLHCHLTSSEVVGYLGGSWNTKTQHLSILEAFPCKCQTTDRQTSNSIEEEIKKSMKRRGLSLVGWYHSHPFNQPDPSIRDIGCQMSYQLRMKGSGATYFPCVGIITSPFYKVQTTSESSHNMFMVMPPLEDEPSDFGVPMKVSYTLNQNHSVTEELLSEMKSLSDFYRGLPEGINFQHSWKSSMTYIEKLKESLAKNLPKDQIENKTLLEFVEHLIMRA